MSYRVLTRDEHFQTTGPKRILALDGGGLRGMLTLGFLRQIEKILRARHGSDPSFRLCHYGPSCPLGHLARLWRIIK